MMENYVEIRYALTKEEAAAGYATEKRERVKRNRNTTIWFVVIMLMFGFSIFRNLTGDAQNNYFLLTYVIFEVLCVVFIIATWVGGSSVYKNAVAAAADGTEYRVFVNEGGISVKYGDGEEIAIANSEYTVTEENELFLITASKQKLILPKRAVPEGKMDTVTEYFFGKVNKEGQD